MLTENRIEVKRMEYWLQSSHSPVLEPYDASNPFDHERAKSRIGRGLNSGPSFVLRNGRKNKRTSPFASSSESGYWTHMYLGRRSGPTYGNRSIRCGRLYALLRIWHSLLPSTRLMFLEQNLSDVPKCIKPSCITALSPGYRLALRLDPNAARACSSVKSLCL